MKIKLTPELSYIIGLWKKRRISEGIGIRGEGDIVNVFSSEVITKGLTTPQKLLRDDKKTYFYHSAYRKFFQKVEKEQTERFKYLNEYAASYLAGMFDSDGTIDVEKGILFFNKANKRDEMLLIRLGFTGVWKQGSLIIGRPKAFLRFIKDYVKIYKDHEIFKHIK